MVYTVYIKIIHMEFTLKTDIRKCENCGKEFVVGSHPNKRFCCRYCKELARRKRQYRHSIEHKIKKNISSSIYKKLKKEDSSKMYSSSLYITDSIQDIKEHIEKQFKEDMTWENHGTLWHIDHIRPQASFKFVNEDGTQNLQAIRECWSKENLQPLYKEDNMSKGSLWNGVRF